MIDAIFDHVPDLGAALALITWVLAVGRTWKNERRINFLVARILTGVTMVLVDLTLIVSYFFHPGIFFFRLAIAAVVGFQIIAGLAAFNASKHLQK